jgi:hypothetical protein
MTQRDILVGIVGANAQKATVLLDRIIGTT